MVNFNLNGSMVEAELHLSEAAPTGVALVPRSMSLLIHSPVLIDLKV
jgi:hypothetical protein